LSPSVALPDLPDPQEQKLLRKLFNPSFYLDRYPDVKESGKDPFLHFVEHGAFEGRSPHPLFDTPFYLAHQPAVAQAGLNPVLHYLRAGASAGANPHPLFDTVYYCNEYPDIAGTGANPLIHFIEHGGVEGRNPHPFFNMAAYLAANPDVDESGINPLLHFVTSGANEGRSIRRVALPPTDRAAGPPVTSGHLITNLRMESLRRKLAIAVMQIDRLKRGLKHPGKLLTCPDPFYQGRVYYCLDGKRHWVVPTAPDVPGDPSQGHLDCYGLTLSDLFTVEAAEMRHYTLAGPLPLLWPEDSWEDPVRNCPYDLRDISTSRLGGSGIEFGAGTSPMGVPLHCDVKYADLFSQQDLHARAYTAQGQDFVPLTYVMGMEDMSAVPDASLDFVIACHVIEHLRNPLRAFEQVYRKLKPGGQYVLIVPDYRRIFDRDRALTPLEHLVEDFENPSAERDVQHYWEFFSKVYGFQDAELRHRVHEAIAGNLDLHFHTWTYESFGEMVKYTQPWSSVWSQPAIWEDPGSQEFYFVLKK
jgi:SAM-dependent methyltransferase